MKLINKITKESIWCAVYFTNTIESSRSEHDVHEDEGEDHGDHDFSDEPDEPCWPFADTRNGWTTIRFYESD